MPSRKGAGVSGSAATKVDRAANGDISSGGGVVAGCQSEPCYLSDKVQVESSSGKLSCGCTVRRAPDWAGSAVPCPRAVHSRYLDLAGLSRLRVMSLPQLVPLWAPAPSR